MSMIKTLPVNLSRIVVLLQQKSWSLDELANFLQLTVSELQKELAYLAWSNLPASLPLMLLDNKQISTALNEGTKNSIEEIIILEAIPSTNEFLKQNNLCAQQLKVCMAEMQTQGKARTGKQWLSPFGLNIYLSFATCYEGSMKSLSGLSLVFALSMVKVLNQIMKYENKKNIRIKWPNDLLVDDKKITGILVETVQQAKLTNLIVGIGLNVNMTQEVDNDLSNIYTSLHLLTHKFYNRNEIAALMLQQLCADWLKFKQHGLAVFLSEWHSVDLLYNQIVSLNYGNQGLKGIARGINEHGYLILEDQAGRIHQFAQGEVSLVRLANVD